VRDPEVLDVEVLELNLEEKHRAAGVLLSTRGELVLQLRVERSDRENGLPCRLCLLSMMLSGHRDSVSFPGVNRKQSGCA
jgi:hypothetical protein